MSSMTKPSAAVRPAAGLPPADHDAAVGHHLALIGVARSEWVKLRSLRSTVLVGLAAAGAVVFFGLLNAVDLAGDWDAASAAQRATMDPMQALIGGWFLAQVMVGVLGVLVVTSEYGSRSMAGTLAAAPRRGWVLAAKLVVPAVAAIALFLPATILTVVVGAQLLPGELAPSVGDPCVVRAVVGVPLAMAAVCAIGGATGFVLRSPAGAIGLLVTVLLVVPGLVAGWSNQIYQWLPGGAIDGALAKDPSSVELPLLDWPGATALLVGYVALAVAAGLLAFRRRDA